MDFYEPSSLLSGRSSAKPSRLKVNFPFASPSSNSQNVSTWLKPFTSSQRYNPVVNVSTSSKRCTNWPESQTKEKLVSLRKTPVETRNRNPGVLYEEIDDEFSNEQSNADISENNGNDTSSSNLQNTQSAVVDVRKEPNISTISQVGACETSKTAEQNESAALFGGSQNEIDPLMKKQIDSFFLKLLKQMPELETTACTSLNESETNIPSSNSPEKNKTSDGINSAATTDNINRNLISGENFDSLPSVPLTVSAPTLETSSKTAEICRTPSDQMIIGSENIVSSSVRRSDNFLASSESNCQLHLETSEEETNKVNEECSSDSLLKNQTQASESLLKTQQIESESVSKNQELASNSKSPSNSQQKESVSKNLAKNSVSPTKNLAKNSVSPTKNLAKNSVSPTKNLAKNSVSPAQNLAKNSVSPTKNQAKNSVSPTKNLAKNSVSPTKNQGDSAPRSKNSLEGDSASELPCSPATAMESESEYLSCQSSVAAFSDSEKVIYILVAI